MDNLKIEGMFPSSISEISMANEESEFGYSITQHRPNQRLADYQIKINGPDSREPEPYEERWDRFDRNVISVPPIIDQNLLPRADWTDFKDKVTGYDLNRDQFSEEEILKAFNIIDIGKDDLINEDDLTFVLDYIKEDYTQEEVKEMIAMLSADKSYVTFDDFKKLGKGEIVPLAKYKLPDQHTRHKGTVLQNIVQTDLLAEDPNFVVEKLKKEAISYQKFEESKKANKRAPTIIKSPLSEKEKLFQAVPLRSLAQLKERKQLFSNVVLNKLDDIVRNYQEHRQKMISLQRLASMLEITTKEARQLYPNAAEVDSLLVIIEAVAYSREKIAKRFELCLELCSLSKKISIGEVVFILQVLKGKDNSLEKKLKAIVLGKGINIEQDIQKSLIYETVLEYMPILLH